MDADIEETKARLEALLQYLEEEAAAYRAFVEQWRERQRHFEELPV